MFHFGEFLIPIALFASIVIIVYLVLRRKERMALLNKGISASIFETRRTPSQHLKWGMVFIGLGIGIIVARILYLHTSMGEEESFFSMIFLFGGTSLVLYHFIAGKLEKRDFPENNNRES